MLTVGSRRLAGAGTHIGHYTRLSCWGGGVVWPLLRLQMGTSFEGLGLSDLCGRSELRSLVVKGSSSP